MMRQIDSIVIHCTATPNLQDIGFTEINTGHKQRGWRDPAGVSCGYHFLIRRNGVIEVGRTPDMIGAHVEGANSRSLGVALIGTSSFNTSQIESLRRLVKSLTTQYPGAKVYPHNWYPSAKKQGKTCPVIDLRVALKGLEETFGEWVASP